MVFIKLYIMKNIPVEFLPGFWVTLPEGLEGQGSGFLLAENIETVFTIQFKIPVSKNYNRTWSIISISENEAKNHNYLSAFVRLITEALSDIKNFVLVANHDILYLVLNTFLTNITGVSSEIGLKIIKSKLG